MKYFILTGVTVLWSFVAIAQPFQEICSRIHTQERGIKTADEYLQKNFGDSALREGIESDVEKDLLPYFIDVGLSFDDIQARLDCITTTSAITWLDWTLVLKIEEIENDFKINGNYSHSRLTPTRLKEIQTLFRKRTEEIMALEFTLYSFTETSNRIAKAVYLEHQNDFFSLYNQDRDLTGAFRFEVFTDLLNLRAITPEYTESAYFWNSRNWYSYQGVFIGGEGYTPYLRDSTIFRDVYSVDSADRPYASFAYFGRSKHRITSGGMFRVSTQTKIGRIGSARGDSIQSSIHRDITIGSLKPKGWGAQIAAGGRIAISQEVLIEGFFHRYFTTSLIKPTYIIEGTLGHDKTSAAVGLNFSNRNLKQRSSLNFSFYHPIWWNCILWNVKGYVRYVQHNSMLEGYGITHQTPDEDPSSPDDAYVLTRGRDGSPDQINEFVYGVELTLSASFEYFSFVFKHSYWSPEYNMLVNSKQYGFGDDGNPGSHNFSPWNHTGTVAMVFRIN